MCAGKPLLLYTCDAASQSRYLNRVVLSTNDVATKSVAENAGVEVPFLRPESLSGHEVSMIDVVRHAYEYLTAKGLGIDLLVLLQPTSPLREVEDIDKAIEIYLRGGVDSVVSVVRVPHIFHPRKLFMEENNLLIPFQQFREDPSNQEESVIFARNGPAVLALNPTVLATESLYGRKSAPYEMKQRNSIDIDSPLDFLFAEFLLNQRNLRGTEKENNREL
jgi:CMP-N-acetylneuraminic acid synthetase